MRHTMHLYLSILRQPQDIHARWGFVTRQVLGSSVKIVLFLESHATELMSEVAASEEEEESCTIL